MSTPLDVLHAALDAADQMFQQMMASINVAAAALGMTGGTLAWTVTQTSGVTMSLTFASMDPKSGATADTEATGNLTIAGLDGVALQAALEALPNIGTGNISVTGSAGGPWTVTLSGGLANTPQPINALTGTITGTGANLSIVPVNPTTQSPGSDQNANLTAAMATFSTALDTYNAAVTSVQSDVSSASAEVPVMATIVGPVSAVNVSIVTGGTPDCASADIEAGVNAAVNGMISQLNMFLTNLSTTLAAMKSAHSSLINAVSTFQSVQLQPQIDTEAQKQTFYNQINGLFP